MSNISGPRNRDYGSVSGPRNRDYGSTKFLGQETDIMGQFLGLETDVMGERYFMFCLFLDFQFIGVSENVFEFIYVY